MHQFAFILFTSKVNSTDLLNIARGGPWFGTFAAALLALFIKVKYTRESPWNLLTGMTLVLAMLTKPNISCLNVIIFHCHLWQS